MLTIRFSSAIILLVAAAAVAVLFFAPSSAQTGSPPPATFNHNTLADFSAVAGEPFIRVDRQDNVYVSSPFGFSTTVSLLWKSTDHGRSFIPLGSPIVRDAVAGPGGGDTHLDFDDRNRLYYADLSAACVTTAVSEDGGNTFPPTRTNFITCIGTDDTTAAQDDRQWIAAFGDGIGYMTVRNLTVSSGGNFHLFKTSDGGQHWDGGHKIGSVTQSGPLQVDKQMRSVLINGTPRNAILLYQLYYTSSTLRLFRVTDLNDGSPLIVDNLTIGTPGGSVSSVFPVLTIDKAGNLYVVWSKNAQAIFTTTSTDRGNTWAAPVQVSPASMTGTNVMPWIVAGDPGRIDVVWYHTPGGNNAQSVWDIHMAQSLNALTAAPSFTVNKVNENTIHLGEICLAGLNCDIDTLTGTPRDRSFAEFPSIDIDSRGAAFITYNDSSNQLPAAYVMVARQIGGASLFASVGSLTDDGTVGITSPAAGETIRTTSTTFSGTHTLPPRDFDKDESGDARFPDHGAVIGSNIPALDIKSVSLADDSTSLAVTMQLADLTTAALATAAAQSGGDGVLYLTQMHSGTNVFWVGAEFRGGQPRFLTGGLGSINSATSKKYITYDPDLVNSLSVSGSFTSAAPGTITMRVPRSLVGNPVSGAVFTSVTGYALSERGPLTPMSSGMPNPSSLPVQVDASGASTYIVGEATQLDGVVEASIDDATFTSPRIANLMNITSENRWQVQLASADLIPGSHTLYVRQRINGHNPSPVASVQFNVSQTIEQVVNSMVSLQTSNPSFTGGVASFNLTLTNTSSQTIFTPLRVEIGAISASATVANADNGLTGAGSYWDYAGRLGADSILSAGETSNARNLRFNDPSGAPFTVTFNVIGNLPRISQGADSGASGTGGSGSGGSGSSGTSSSTGTLTSMIFQITYNPLLNTVTVQLFQ